VDPGGPLLYQSPTWSFEPDQRYRSSNTKKISDLGGANRKAYSLQARERPSSRTKFVFPIHASFNIQDSTRLNLVFTQKIADNNVRSKLSKKQSFEHGISKGGPQAGTFVCTKRSDVARSNTSWSRSKLRGSSRSTRTAIGINRDR